MLEKLSTNTVNCFLLVIDPTEMLLLPDVRTNGCPIGGIDSSHQRLSVGEQQIEGATFAEHEHGLPRYHQDSIGASNNLHGISPLNAVLGPIPGEGMWLLLERI